MGKFSRYFSKSWAFKFLILGLLFLSYKVLENTRFESIDYFIRDSLQYLNSSDEVDKSFVTLNININSDGITTPHNYTGTKRIIDKLQEYDPKHIIIMMEPLDFSSDPIEKKKLYEYFKEQKNLYLNKYEARHEMVSFAKDEVFKNFERMISFDRCLDSPKDRENRRAFLAFNNLGQAEIFSQLQSLGYNPKPLTEIKYKFDHWNTLQAYVKNYKLGTFGNHQSHDLLKDKLQRQLFEGKTVLIGINNEFSMLTSRSVFELFANRGQKNIQNTRVPLQDVFANILSFHTTGNYMKFLKHFDDLGASIFVLILLLFCNINIITKIYFFLSLIPLILVIQIFIYAMDSYYIDFSRSIVLLMLAQYFSIPFVFLNHFKRSEKLKSDSINKARIDALLNISSAVAHDLRSPLSTISLLLSKAKFPNLEQEKLIQSSLERLNSIIENLVNKHREESILKLEEINLTDIVNQLLDEKRIKAPNVKYEVQLKDNLTVFADKNIIERILSNVIDNSIEATNKQLEQRIQILFNEDEELVELKISDNGPGIPQPVLRLIGNQVITTKGLEKGNGIGLLHSVRMLDKLKGSLVVHSLKTGGTTVFIRLPKRSQ